MIGFQHCCLITLSLVSSHLYAQCSFHAIQNGKAMFEVEKMCGRPLQRNEKVVCSSTQGEVVTSGQIQISRSASISAAGPSGQYPETAVAASVGVNRTETYAAARSATNTALVCRKVERWSYQPGANVTRDLVFTDGILSDMTVGVR